MIYDITKEKEFRQKRKDGIGGSDIAAILGISPFKRPIDVYLEKTEFEQQSEFNNNPAILRGKRMEKYIIEEYEERTNNKVTTNVETIYHPDYPFIYANIDGIIAEDKIVIEAKSCSSNKWQAVPNYYETQAAYYAMITDCKRVDIPVVFNGFEYQCFKYHRNEMFEKVLLDKAVKFWTKHVLKKKPPAITSAEDVTKFFKKDNGKVVVASSKITRQIKQLQAVNLQIATAKMEQKKIMDEIKYFMQDNQSVIQGKDSSEILVSWKTYNKKSFDHFLFKNENPDLYNQYLTKKTSRLFKIKNKC